MKPIAVDEMFSEGVDVEDSAIVLDSDIHQRDIHADFFNDFEDLFDEDLD